MKLNASILTLILLAKSTNAMDQILEVSDEKQALLTEQLFNNVAIKADVQEIEQLLNDGANVHARNWYGPMLSWAAKYGHNDACKVLLEKGASINEANYRDETSLILAAKKGDLGLCTLLVTKNANISAVDKFSETALIKALARKKYTVAEFLLENDKKEIEPALMWSAQKGDLATAEFLLNHGAELNSKLRSASLNETPLLVSVANGHYLVSKLFIERGADIEAKFRFKETSLIMAVHRNLINLCALLLKNNANVDGQDHNGITPLMHAADKGNLELCKLLIAHGADVAFLEEEYQQSALLFAAKKLHYEVCQLLLEHGAAKVASIYSWRHRSPLLVVAAA